MLKDTGCAYLAMGIESGDEDFRKTYLNRKMTNAQIENAFYLARKAHIFTTSFNIIGFPFENDHFLTDETVSLNKKIKPDYALFSIFYPFPGTKLYERCIEKNLIDNQKASDVKNYFTESILKGVALGERLKEINAFFNPYGMLFINKNKCNFFSFFMFKLKRIHCIHKFISLIPFSLKKILKRISFR
jgi:radical SAM superfamily enzyme YgiQ (UPF0313 family)